MPVSPLPPAVVTTKNAGKQSPQVESHCLDNDHNNHHENVWSKPTLRNTCKWKPVREITATLEVGIPFHEYLFDWWPVKKNRAENSLLSIIWESHEHLKWATLICHRALHLFLCLRLHEVLICSDLIRWPFDCSIHLFIHNLFHARGFWRHLKPSNHPRYNKWDNVALL